MCNECSDYSILESQLTSIEESVDLLVERVDHIDEEINSLTQAIELLIDSLKGITEDIEVIDLLKQAQSKLY